MINHLTDAKEKNFKNVEEKYFKTVKTKIGTSFSQDVYRCEEMWQSHRYSNK